MARQTFHSQVAIEAGTASTDAVTKSQLDTAEAAAKARANHTGTQASTTISDFTTAVDARIATVIDAAPTALDTLNELAAALGDDPNFSATVTTSLDALDTRIDSLEASTGAGGYTQLVGDAVASTFTVTHNLGTTSVIVQIFAVSNGQTVFPVVTRPSTNTVALDFGTTVPASNAMRVLVYKVA